MCEQPKLEDIEKLFGSTTYYKSTMVTELEEVTVTRKGQVTIPVKYRRKYGINEGTKMLIEDAEGASFSGPSCA